MTGYREILRTRTVPDNSTHIDISSQQLVRSLIFLEDVVVNRAAGERAPQEEAEETVQDIVVSC